MATLKMAPTEVELLLHTAEGEFAQMVALVETQLSEAIAAFERRDVALAEKVALSDEKVDALNQRLDDRAFALLQAKSLSDRVLRHAASFLKLSGELERVGDLAKNVAKRSVIICRQPPFDSSQVAGIVRLGRASLRQLSDILDAYQAGNLAGAEAVWSGDDDLDELYNSLYAELIGAMTENPVRVEPGAHLLFIVKNFERIGDHATNIAEVFHFLETGAHFEDDRPKGQDPATVALPPRAS